MYVLQLEQGRFCKFCQLRIVFSQVKDRFCKYYKLSTIILQVLEVEICIFASISSWDLRLCATTTLQWTPEAGTRLGGGACTLISYGIWNIASTILISNSRGRLQICFPKLNWRLRICFQNLKLLLQCFFCAQNDLFVYSCFLPQICSASWILR